MTPQDLAHLHARAFTTPAAWSAKDFAGFLDDRTVRLIERAHGFLLLRIVADEAEVLTLAVAPDARRKGTGRALVVEAVEAARAEGAVSIFLEVAADNAAALALYASEGFRPTGKRPGYYRTPDGNRIDALVFKLSNVASAG